MKLNDPHKTALGLPFNMNERTLQDLLGYGVRGQLEELGCVIRGVVRRDAVGFYIVDESTRSRHSLKAHHAHVLETMYPPAN